MIKLDYTNPALKWRVSCLHLLWNRSQFLMFLYTGTSAKTYCVLPVIVIHWSC